MKKAKIMLTAITVLAIVGGALAFKAKTLGAQVFCTDTDGKCTLAKDNYTTAFQQTTDKIDNAHCAAASTTTDCGPITIYRLQ